MSPRNPLSLSAGLPEGDVRGRSPAGHGAAVVPGAAAATARGALWRHGDGAWSALVPPRVLLELAVLFCLSRVFDVALR